MGATPLLSLVNQFAYYLEFVMYCQLTQDLINQDCSADLTMHEWQMRFNDAEYVLDALLHFCPEFGYDWSMDIIADMEEYVL
jgi:hypothetical protein